MHSCTSSEDSIQCIETKNEDKIWIQVLIVVLKVFNFWLICIYIAILDWKRNKFYFRQILVPRNKSVKQNQMEQKKFDFFNLKKKN